MLKPEAGEVSLPHGRKFAGVAALLGADRFGFGTAALVAIGCKMARQCHLNTCPVGIATQAEEFREKYFGTPEMLITFLTHVAQEVREILAELGYNSLEDVIGRADLLRQIPSDGKHRWRGVDLSKIITPASGEPLRCVAYTAKTSRCGGKSKNGARQTNLNWGGQPSRHSCLTS